MSTEFDPYQVWLSIPPNEQPANFYRLLGLPLFESNPDVISNAADRQMAFVRTFQTGKYSELSQKILNELSQARITLLDAQKKAQYDATLHGEQNVEQTANQSGSFGEIQSPPPPSADTLTPQQPSDASQSFWGNFNDASGSSAGSSNILTASTKNAEFSFSAPDSAAQKSDSSSFSSINTESGIHFKDHVTKTSSPKIKKKSNHKKVSPVKRKNNNTLMFAGIGGGVLFLLMIVIIFFSGSGEKASKRITDDDASLKRTYLEQANNYFTNHEYEKAVDAYQKASELDPDDNYASDQISIIYRYYLNGETQAKFGKNKNNANVSSVVDSNRGASANAYEEKHNRKKRVHTDAKEIEPPPTDELQSIYDPRQWSGPDSEETPQESKSYVSAENLVAGTRKTIVVNGVEFAFRWCPPGTFLMGSPESEKGHLDYPDKNNNNEALHEVTLTKGFWIMETEVTQKQWQAVMGYNPCRFKNDNCPVECVSWSDCQKFCFQLGFQLPTEAQWEYACRAGSSDTYAGNLNEMAWYDSNSGNKTHPVGMKKPNAWGLYDMHGNVWEWCQDWQLLPYPGVSETDPVGPSNGIYRVHRGGSWRHGGTWCRSAYRSGHTPDDPASYIGFRCICAKMPVQSESPEVVNEDPEVVNEDPEVVNEDPEVVNEDPEVVNEDEDEDVVNEDEERRDLTEQEEADAELKALNLED